MLKSLFLVLAIGAFSIASAQDGMPENDMEINMQANMGDDMQANMGGDMQDNMNAVDPNMGDEPIDQNMDTVPADQAAPDMQDDPDMEAASGQD